MSIGRRHDVSVARIAAFVALWLCAATVVVRPQVSAQPPAQSHVGTGAISGIVTDGQTKQPVAGALVQLVSSLPGGAAPWSPPRQMTDGSGRFVFQQLAAGSYSTRVTAPGYLDGGYARVPGLAAAGQIELQDKQWCGDANAVLWKPASISGIIRDERGEPVVDVPVRILAAFGVAGHDQWAVGTVTRTDDRGAYRFAGLLPGRYVVQVPSIQITLPQGEVALYRWRKVDPLPVIGRADGAGTMAGYFPVPPPGSGQAYPATFYPAARSVSAAGVIAVDFDSERRAVDVSLVPASSVSVSGAVVGPAKAIADLPVRLMAAGNESLGFGGETALTNTDMSGRFTLAHVPQGDYTLIVGRAITEFVLRAGGRSDLEPQTSWGANPFLSNMSSSALRDEPSLSISVNSMTGDDVTGRVSVSVGADAVEGLVVPVAAGVTISGHALFDGADEPTAAGATLRFGPMIETDPADGDISRTSSSSLSGFVMKPAAVNASGDFPGPAFSITNVVPGRYRITDGGNRPYRLIGATWRGQDLFATPLEVTGDAPVTDVVAYLSSKHNSISGLVRAADRDALSAGAVLIFPQDRNRWNEPGLSAVQFRVVDVSPTGGFTVDDLIPGDYYIAAVPTEDRRRRLDIEFLTLLAPQAKRITIDEAAALTMDLHITGVRR